MRQLLPLCVLLLLASLAVAPGCNPVDDVTPEDVCDDARRAIGLRTEACTGDAKLADERFERASALKCKARTVEASFYSCSKAILAYPCSTVAALGEDLPSWVQIDACAPLFVGSSTGVCTQSPDGSCSCIQPQEKPVCELPPASTTATPYCCVDGEYPAHGFCVCRYMKCVEQGASCVCSASEALTGTPTLECFQSAKPDYEECCAGNGKCTCRPAKGCTGGTVSVPSCTPQTLCAGTVVTTCSL